MTFDHHARAELVASSAPGHGLNGIRPGASADAVKSVRRVAPGVYVRPLSSRNAAVYVSNGKRITAVAVATTALARHSSALQRSLQLAGLV